MDAVFSWAFDHRLLLFGGIIAAAVWIMYFIGRPRRWWKWPVHALAVIAIAISALALFFFASVSSAIDGRLASLTFSTAPNAQTHKVSDYRGKVVLVNYWATWCPPCRAEIPDLNRAADQWRGPDVVFLAITDEDFAMIDKFTQRFPIHADVARFTSDAPRGAIATMAYRGRPTTLILDREGHMKRVLIGAQTFEKLDDAIRSVL